MRLSGLFVGEEPHRIRERDGGTLKDGEPGGERGDGEAFGQGLAELQATEGTFVDVGEAKPLETS
jgi:hypothetical protein